MGSRVLLESPMQGKIENIGHYRLRLLVLVFWMLVGNENGNENGNCQMIEGLYRGYHKDRFLHSVLTTNT